MTSMIAALKDDLLVRLDETRWKIAARGMTRRRNSLCLPRRSCAGATRPTPCTQTRCSGCGRGGGDDHMVLSGVLA